jgi:hypothetical protein
MNCPNCSSSNTRTFSIVYEEGTSHSKGEGTTSGSNYETKNFSQTPLAKRCSPPQGEMSVMGAIFFAIGFFLSFIVGFKIGHFTGSFWWGCGALAISFAGCYVSWQYIFGAKMDKQLKLDYSVWKKSWICMKCGNDFLAD